MLFGSSSVQISISVTATDVADGVIQIDGQLIFENGTLTLEYHTMTHQLKKTGLHTLELSLSDIREVQLKKGLLGGAKIIVRPRRLATLEETRGLVGDALVLNVKRKNREKAASLVSMVRLELSEAMLDEM